MNLAAVFGVQPGGAARKGGPGMVKMQPKQLEDTSGDHYEALMHRPVRAGLCLLLLLHFLRFSLGHDHS